MTRVLAAIDNSITARPVLSISRALANVLGADADSLYVGDDEAKTARACAEHLQVPFHQAAGDPFDRITEQADADDVVAVAIGARNLRNGRRVGHLARAVADAIDKPVVVVPPEACPIDHLRTVVVAMDGEPRKARALRTAVDVAADPDLDLVVVHVDDESSIPSFFDHAAHDTDAYAAEFVARHLHDAPPARLELRIGVPADEIIDVTEAVKADMLAIGWPRSAPDTRGAVARELLDRSRVPVLLVALDLIEEDT